MLFDKNNWLWILGTSPNISGFNLSNRDPIIERFNGSSFNTITLPKTNFGSNQNVFLYKRSDGMFYVLFSQGAISKLYIFSPETLIFTEIKIPF